MSDYEEIRLERAADYKLQAAELEYQRAAELSRPFHLLKPKIGIDGNMYCFLFGENLMEGVAGFGETAELAALDFDKNWKESKAPKQAQPPYPFCRTPKECAGKGYCPKDPACNN